jgi:hypothetical protein
LPTFPKHTQKAAAKLQKRILCFRKETQEFWSRVKERFVALLTLAAEAEPARAWTDTAAEAEALVLAVEAAPAGEALLAEARAGWTRLYEEFKVCGRV